MPAVTIRNLSVEVHRALKQRAAQHHRSTEAEIRAILEDAVQPEGRVLIGSVLRGIGQAAEFTDAEIDAIQQSRDKRGADPISLE